ARGVSIGRALSDLARKGATAHPPRKQRNGFYLFPAGKASKRFGPGEVEAALAAEDIATARQFVKGSRKN
ncbi:MAG: hypothetical protein ACRD96_06095, partial [Bryobacteraceae bacterium]